MNNEPLTLEDVICGALHFGIYLALMWGICVCHERDAAKYGKPPTPARAGHR